jgi:glycosyltransferase involved in cell wall biosynthesis
MNILMFNYEYPPLGGGGGVVHQAVAEELAREHRVCIVTSAYRDLPGHEVAGGVDIHRVPVIGRDSEAVATLSSMLSYPPSAWLRARSILGGEHFDVVNGHFAIPTGPASLPVARAARLPHVLSVHGGDLYDPSKKLSPHRIALLRATVRALMRASDSVVANSRNTADNARRYYGFAGPIELIPLGITRPDVPPASRDRLGLPDGFLAVTVGRLIPRKDLAVLVDAIAASGVSEAHLVLVGDGPELPGLKRRVEQLGIASRVHFLGYVEERRKLQILRAADVYVSSSMHEGFGLVYLEAMAAGLPIVTTDNGGHTDFLVHGENALLVPVGDSAALAEAIGRIGARPETARAMREANLAKAERFEASRCAREYERFFARVIEAATARRRGGGNTAPWAAGDARFPGG